MDPTARWASGCASPSSRSLDREATAQVDGITEAAIADFLRRLGTTGVVVTIAHRPSTGIDADPIVVMAEGRVRARGIHSELLASDGLCRELAEALRIGDAAEIP